MPEQIGQHFAEEILIAFSGTVLYFDSNSIKLFS